MKLQTNTWPSSSRVWLLVNIILLFYAPGRVRAPSDFMYNGLRGSAAFESYTDQQHERKNSQKLLILSTAVAKPSSSLTTAENSMMTLCHCHTELNHRGRISSSSWKAQEHQVETNLSDTVTSAVLLSTESQPDRNVLHEGQATIEYSKLPRICRPAPVAAGLIPGARLLWFQIH